MRASGYLLLLTGALLALLMFQNRRWKPLEVFGTDPGGYYVYLPSAFIFHDLARADSLEILHRTYKPGTDVNIGLVPVPERGGYITKYPLGVALADVPWFLGAHLYAGLSAGKYAPDGFSRPYQQIIMVAGLAHALLGLWVLRKLLRRCFPADEPTVAWTLAAIGLGTNLFCYASLEAAMAHAPLFLWQASLLYCTARWYESRRPQFMLGIGLFLGLAVLTRPTEVLYALVPLLWGLTSVADLRARVALWWQHRGPLLAAGLVFGLVVGLQPLFWRTTTGHWLFYSYRNEHFDFLHPHLFDGLLSFRKGWLLYTPLAGLALLGVVGALRRQLAAAWLPALVTAVAVVYVTFSWEQWWYGGGFSARPLISLYPLLALGLAALLVRARTHGRPAYTLLRTLLVLGILLNLWQTRQYGAGIISWDGTTAEAYFSHFFNVKL
ncbi:ArnT family glycosyltransferase [Hymenobacter sp. APR13]|uniref:ArnT family glycosyltransferase n=1 Tax=Hymenobacter sp. APR13 TaxID=1356852 RepID=UPI0009DFEED4|nr:glycosyltransferase family 39 protein [Hymenobacter sp. APR13]